MLKISVCSENCKKACWKFQHVLKTVMHVVCLKFQHIKTMLNILGCVENMLKTSRHVENYNMCRKLCWNSMLKISHVLNTVRVAESHVKTSRHVENVYVRHVENHIENHVEVRKKTITLYGTCRNWAADFVFLLQFARVTEVRHICLEDPKILKFVKYVCVCGVCVAHAFHWETVCGCSCLL